MKIVELPDAELQPPNVLVNHLQVMLQVLQLAEGDELVRVYRAVRDIVNGSK